MFKILLKGASYVERTDSQSRLLGVECRPESNEQLRKNWFLAGTQPGLSVNYLKTVL